MSIIVAVVKDDKTAIASDSAQFYGTRREGADNLASRPKIRRFHSCLLGNVGAAIYDILLDDYVARGTGLGGLTNELTILKFFVGFWKFMRDEYHLVNDLESGDDESQFARLDAQFIVVDGRSLFTVDSDLNVMRFQRYCAIGTGAPFAYGLLYGIYNGTLSAKKIACRAAEAAVHFDESCGGEVQVFEAAAQ